jgi:hypothetical protein
VLALAAAAVVAGMKGYTAIIGRVADVPSAILADLYLRSGAAPAAPPSKTTIWRVLTDADGFGQVPRMLGQQRLGFQAAGVESPLEQRSSRSRCQRMTHLGGTGELMT